MRRVPPVAEIEGERRGDGEPCRAGANPEEDDHTEADDGVEPGGEGAHREHAEHRPAVDLPPAEPDGEVDEHIADDECGERGGKCPHQALDSDGIGADEPAEHEKTDPGLE